MKMKPYRHGFGIIFLLITLKSSFAQTTEGTLLQNVKQTCLVEQLTNEDCIRLDQLVRNFSYQKKIDPSEVMISLGQAKEYKFKAEENLNGVKQRFLRSGVNAFSFSTFGKRIKPIEWKVHYDLGYRGIEATLQKIDQGIRGFLQKGIKPKALYLFAGKTASVEENETKNAYIREIQKHFEIKWSEYSIVIETKNSDQLWRDIHLTYQLQAGNDDPTLLAEFYSFRVLALSAVPATVTQTIVPDNQMKHFKFNPFSWFASIGLLHFKRASEKKYRRTSQRKERRQGLHQLKCWRGE